MKKRDWRVYWRGYWRRRGGGVKEYRIIGGVKCVNRSTREVIESKEEGGNTKKENKAKGK